MHVKRVDSELVFEGKVFRVRIDRLEIDSERTIRVDVVEHGGAVAIVALDDSDRFWLVRQYRHPAEKALLEIPAGTLEQGEAPQNCALRECQEEIGMIPGKLTSLGGFYLAPGYSTEFLHLFLAQDLSPSRLEGDAEEDIQAEPVPLSKVRAMMLAGEFQDAKSIAGLALALGVLEKGRP